MNAIPQGADVWTWNCLHCGTSLDRISTGLQCDDCGRLYPTIGGIPILVREPIKYIRSEIASLRRTIRAAERQLALLAGRKHDTGLPEASVERHRDVIRAEIARAEMFLGLLEPAGHILGRGADSPTNGSSAGWTTDALVPYLLRDWTGTAELDTIAGRIAGALKRSVTDASEKSVVCVACGAGGLLARIAPDFKRVLGFDLALPTLMLARHLLNGKSVDLALPQIINRAGFVTLSRSADSAVGSRVELVGMDALDTAFADGSIDCVVTSFLLDLVSEPLAVASEIHRILAADGVWINYGPSGPPRATWRFDSTESAAFLQEAGFRMIVAQSHRSTYLDVSKDCPSWSFQNHICYLTSACKAGPRARKRVRNIPGRAELPDVIPCHFPGARIVESQSLTGGRQNRRMLRHEAIPGRTQSFDINSGAVAVLELVDDARTIREISMLLGFELDEAMRLFEGYLEAGLLSWRGRDHVL